MGFVKVTWPKCYGFLPGGCILSDDGGRVHKIWFGSLRVKKEFPRQRNGNGREQRPLRKEDIASGDGEEETPWSMTKTELFWVAYVRRQPWEDKLEADFEEPINHVKEDTDCPNHPFLWKDLKWLTPNQR